MIYNNINNQQISYLGLGIMRHSDNQEDTNKIIKYAIKNGINYFEGCDFYNKGKCEERLAEALSPYPRSSYFLCDKLPLTGFFNRNLELKDFFFQQLKKMKTSYFDVYLIQAVDRNNLNLLIDNKVIDFYNQMKKERYIKSLGFSFHDNAETLQKILDLNNWDIVQFQLNYYDWYLGEAKEIYQLAQKYNLPISVMGPTKGGLLIHDLPQESQQRLQQANVNPAYLCYDFLTTLKNVKIILSGAERLDYLKDNLNYFNNEDYGITLNGKKHILKNIEDYTKTNLINCTNCKYCISHCSKQIPINEIFYHYNQFLLTKNIEEREWLYNTFKSAIGSHNCIHCGNCMKYCPQHLNIQQHFAKNIFPLRR